MKKINLILFVFFISLGTVNLSTPNNKPDRQNNIPNLSNNGAGNNLINDNLNMPVPPEDVNNDGIVDSDDLAICLIESYDFCQESCQADVNGDTLTDLTDLIFIYNYICNHLNV